MDTAIRTRSLTAPLVARNRSGLPLLIVNAAIVLIIVVVVYALPVGDTTLSVGTVAGDTIVARHKATYTDWLATSVRKRQMRQSIPPVYMPDTSLAVRRKREASEFFDKVQPIVQLSISPAAKLSRILRLLPSDVSESALEEFANLTPADYTVVRQRSLALLDQALDWRFNAGQVTSTEIGLLAIVSSHVTKFQTLAIGEILSTFLAPTQVENTPATEKLRSQAAAHVSPVISTIYPGEVVVRRGDVVTRQVMAKLTALGLQRRGLGWQDVSASLLFTAVVLMMLFWYLHAFHTSVACNPRLLLLVDSSLVVTVVATRLIPPSHILLPYFLPVAAAPTFAAILLGSEAATAVALTMAILAGWITANSFELATYYFLSAAAGVLAVRHVRRLKQFMIAGGSIMVFALITVLAYGLVDRAYDAGALQDYVMAAVFNGFVSSTLALGGFALLAGYFGVTTSLHLLELAQPSQPLLRRIMSKAPGTYNHSLIVGSMVEHAAEEIGADSLIAKVGAMYHDVGKTANPHCFVENQLGIGNIHDELHPDESARIIRGHVTLGLRLARQYKLPRVVLDAIAEHHGTMSIAYFLHRAREYGEDPIDIGLYTYPGPKPQSKETALIMLADGCESAVRAASDRSPDYIRDVVDRIFRERIDHGQLSECPLTLRDLQAAREAFLSVLTGLYHPRIEYPETSEMQAEPPIDIREHGLAR